MITDNYVPASVEKKTQRIEEEKKTLEKARAEKKKLIKQRRTERKPKRNRTATENKQNKYFKF